MRKHFTRILSGFRLCGIRRKLIPGVLVIMLAAGPAHGLDLQSMPWRVYQDRGGRAGVAEIAAIPRAQWRQLLPCICWGEQGLDFPRDKATGQRIVWYCCDFDLPAGFTLQNPVLHIGAIDDLDQTFLNKTRIGATGTDTDHYWRAARQYSIPGGLLRAGRNTLLIRVTDLRGDGGISQAPVEIVDRCELRLPPEPPNPLQMRMYTQKLEIVYASPEDADRAKVTFAPLLDNKTWAFSGRWDDNNRKHPRMRALLAKYGYKANFYLYSNYRHKASGMGCGAEYARNLMRGGFGIGGHSMTHPPLAQINRNEMFYEIAAIRVEREVDIDTPISSFVFPGGNYQNSFDRIAQRDIGQALLRCGYHHVTYRGFVSRAHGVSPLAFSTVWNICPGDREARCEKFDRDVSAGLRNHRFWKMHPNMTLGIHVWHTEAGWKNLEKSLARYANRPDWWYCNQNEYAAYRYQFHHARIQAENAAGTKRLYVLTRPFAADLGDNVPLTLLVKNAVVKSCALDGAGIPVMGNMINLPHAARARTPERIDALQNLDNQAEPAAGYASRKFPGLIFFLRIEQGKDALMLHAENRTRNDLVDTVVTFRLPPVCRNGLRRLKLGRIGTGEKRDIRLLLGDLRKEPSYHDGLAYFVAQIDFRQGETIGRFYATARESGPVARANCFRDTALISAPFALGSIEDEPLRAASQPGALLPDLGDGKWSCASGQDCVAQQRETARIRLLGAAMARARKLGEYGICVCAEFICTGPVHDVFMLNGRRRPDMVFLNGTRCKNYPRLSGMKSGRNRLLLLYRCDGRKIKPWCVFVRLTPGHGLSFEAIK